MLQNSTKGKMVQYAFLLIALVALVLSIVNMINSKNVLKKGGEYSLNLLLPNTTQTDKDGNTPYTLDTWYVDVNDTKWNSKLNTAPITLVKNGDVTKAKHRKVTLT